jgi:hypothetical protein
VRAEVRRGIVLNKDDVEWFESTFPHGSLSALLQRFLTKYREATTLTPDDYISIAIKALEEEG